MYICQHKNTLFTVIAMCGKSLYIRVHTYLCQSTHIRVHIISYTCNFTSVMPIFPVQLYSFYI